MPPDTSVYYHVAYTWVAAVYVAYIVSIGVRARRARRRLEAAPSDSVPASIPPSRAG
jgi:hypothetical protein